MRSSSSCSCDAALSFNFARSRADHATYAALPAWARATLAEHAADRRVRRPVAEGPRGGALARPAVERRDERAARRAAWSRATRGCSGASCRSRGCADPRTLTRAVVHLNDRWALDGRDPNGYANVSWCFGLHDRPWPSRPVFGRRAQDDERERPPEARLRGLHRALGGRPDQPLGLLRPGPAAAARRATGPRCRRAAAPRPGRRGPRRRRSP